MNAIEINNLSKSFGSFGIKNINLKIPQGSVVGLIGENGAGKTTLIKLILNMLNKDNGNINILGNDYKECDKNDIGVVFDESCFPQSLNAKEINNILKNSFNTWNEKEYFDLLNRFSLPINKNFKTFSKGMKMKLSIAVALSHNAKLLILDEPTSGLDPIIRDEIIDIFNEFTRNEEHTILISSHIISDLEKLCDYIAFIHNGSLMLFEEKDILLDKYCIVIGSKDEIEQINQNAIIGIKENNYGAKAIVEKEFVPKEMTTSKVSIEDLFLYMIKGAKK